MSERAVRPGAGDEDRAGWDRSGHNRRYRHCGCGRRRRGRRAGRAGRGSAAGRRSRRRSCGRYSRPSVSTPSWISTTIASAPSARSRRDGALIASASSPKVRPATPPASPGWRVLRERQADEADLHLRAPLPKLRMAVGREQGLASPRCGHWRRGSGSARRGSRIEPRRARGWCGARSRHSACAAAPAARDRTRDCRPREIEPDHVERQDRRLVEKLGGDERRGADQVAGGDDELFGLPARRPPDRRGDIGRAAGGHADLACRPAPSPDRQARRLQRAVEIVEAR